MAMDYEFATRAIHAGQPTDEQTGAVSFPIYQTSTFGQEMPGVNKGYVYARTGNPGRTALEECLASLEDAKFAYTAASGMAAINNILCLLKAGDHVVTCQDLYGGAYRMFTKLYAKFGVTFSFVDATSLDNIEKAFTPQTKMLWLETPSNPLLRIIDLAGASKIGKKKGAIVVVDNTFASPYLQAPLKLGADIVMHSTTKYLNGHSDVLGGASITNDPALAEQLKFFQNCVGAVPAPMDCFLNLRGIKTLPVRMDRHCANARQIAEYFVKHPKIAKVYFPGLPTHPGHEIAKKQMKDFGAMVSIELKTDIEETRKFTSYIQLWTLAESLGGVKSLLCQPATMTHASVDPAMRRQVGISDGLIRLSCGLEDARDLIKDLEQALEKVRVGAAVA
ncbi:MAG TPA: cystathionine gamma-synthase [Planctomycetota bacterium]